MRASLLFLPLVLAACSTTALQDAGRKPSSASSDCVASPSERCSGEQILLLSDIHFDPLYDPALVQNLKNAQSGSDWGSIFETSTVTALSRPKDDTNYPLFRSSLAAMKAAVADPAVILISGDFLRHNFTLAVHTQPGHALEFPKKWLPTTTIDPVVLDMATKTIQFIADSLHKTFPKAQIIPTVGNNDSACDDYEVEPSEAFLGAMAKAFAPYSNTADFASQFSGSGHFSTQVAGLPNVQLISANDVYWSSHYYNGCGDSSSDPGQDELTWLTGKLAETGAAGKKAWLLNHIPAGIDADSTISSLLPACVTKKFTTMIGKWNSPYLSLVGTYGSVIGAAFVGHTHNNEFRIYKSASGNPIPAFVLPSISPVHENNPAFQIMNVDKQSASIQNIVTYSVDLSGAQQWRQTSDFRQDYHVQDLSGPSLIAALGELQSDPARLQAYILRMNSGAQSPTTVMDRSPSAFACAISNLDTDSFGACYCQ